MDGNAVQPGANLTVYDVYSNESDYNTMKADSCRSGNSTAARGRGTSSYSRGR